MHIDDDLESHHPRISAHILGETDLQELIELLVNVLQLLLDRGDSEYIFLAQHLGSLLREEFLTAFHHFSQLIENLSIYLFRWDMTAETRVVHDIARLIANESRFGGIAKFIKNKTGKKRLFRHRFITLFSVCLRLRQVEFLPRSRG